MCPYVPAWLRLAKPAAVMLVALLSASPSTWAQGKTSERLRIIVPTPPGSAPDLIARLIGDALQSRLGQTVLIDNRPGAGGIVAVMATKTSPPDGNTLLLAQAAAVAVTPLTYRAATYDMRTDFETISVVASTPLVFAANPSAGLNSLADAIAQAKAKPGAITIGSTGRGSIPHLSGELLRQMSGADFYNVPMSNSDQAIQAIVNGDSQMTVDGFGPLQALIRSGRIKALAVTADRPLPGLEGIPLAKDTVPGLVTSGWFMLFAPKGTSANRVREINGAIDEILKTPDVIEKLRISATYPVGGSVANARAFLARETTMLGAAVKQIGLERE